MVRLTVALLLVVVLLCCAVLLMPGPVLSEKNDIKPVRRTTLLNHWRGENWEKAIVSFRLERPYTAALGPHNEWDLEYGGLSYNFDGDWLKVNCDRNSWSRIRDLGELDWSDDIKLPVLHILPCDRNEPCGRVKIPPPNSGKKIEDEDVNPHIAKPKVGHMYLVHRFREKRRRDQRVFQTLSDYYTLVRVEELKPNESCTISWKRVSAPRR